MALHKHFALDSHHYTANLYLVFGSPIMQNGFLLFLVDVTYHLQLKLPSKGLLQL